VEISPELLGLAEDANSYTPLSPGSERIVEDRFILWLGRGDAPAWNVAQRFRLTPGNVEQALEDVHELVRARGRKACTWEVGSSATPGDLPARLLALGLVPDREPLAIGMVLTEAPAQGPVDVTVRRAETTDDFRAHARIAGEAFGGSPEEIERSVERAEIEEFETGAMYLAFLDGEPIATATATFTEWGVVLNAGSTRESARGRGAYRALVAARWEDAVARGTPALVTQAGAMSRPILERLGFREVCEIRIFLDEFGG